MTWRQGFGLGFLFFGALGVACAGSPPSPEAPVQAPASAEVAGAGAAPAAPEPSSPSSAAPLALAPPEATPPPVPPPLVPICLAKCDKLQGKCTPPQVDSCRLNCTKYEPPPSACRDEVRAALECARDARDLTCANVAPETCARKFRAIAACNSGEAPKVAKAPAGLPEGWEHVADAANGFSAALPFGSVEKAGPDGPVRSVTAPDGTVYTVSVLPPLKDKPSNKSFLLFLMKVMGRCSDKVKLDGFIEKAGHSSIHYAAHCPDKTDWDGMIYVNAQHLILLSAQAPTGKIGLTEPLFYEFEFSGH